MKPLTPFLLALGLLAADAWQTKPFEEWSDKDVNKILTSSPWAHTVSVGAGPASGPEAGLPGRDIPGSRAGGLDAGSGPPVMAPGDPTDQDPGRLRRPSDSADSLGERSVPLTVLWQSALPVKQALARHKYGAEAATSPESKQFLEEHSTYLVAVSGLTPALTQGSRGKGMLIQRTTLAAKGKEPLRPSDVVFGPPGKLVQVVFVFPRSAPFTMEDKDVEFSTQFGPSAVKYKFHLKDMLFHGALEL